MRVLGRNRRDIFEFYDGSQKRRVDPLVILDSLQDHEFDVDTDLEKAISGDVEANRRLVSMVRDVFGIKQYEDGGLTHLECSDNVFEKYMTFIHELKKKRNVLPMPPEPTVSESSETTSTMPHESDSSSTKDEQTNDEPS